MRRGQQLDPDDWNASGMPVDDDTAELVVHFGDAATVTTAAEVCGRLGIPLAAFHEGMAGLVANGFLTVEPDGSYAADLTSEVRQ
ncbi:hypothetical protein ABKW28_22390 [Nocardioides sp. 31GB23]|uniref:hypothetical protein n=1 Tax=Nocardioides sp. 31GB23 TaxID=3156065 RepID=UPI0032AF0806